MTGPSESEAQFLGNITDSTSTIDLNDLASWTLSPIGGKNRKPTWELPLMPTRRHIDVLKKIRAGARFEIFGKSRKSKIRESRPLISRVHFRIEN